MNLPDRRELPDYYKSIKNPIALSEIESRMINRAYQTWEEFFEEVELMIANALVYNEDGSEVFRDAQQIKVGSCLPGASVQWVLSTAYPRQSTRGRPRPIDETCS